MNSANGRPARSGFFGPGRIVEGKGPGARPGRRRFRPAVAGLEGRQLLSGSPTLTTLASFGGAQQAVVAVTLDGQGNLYGTTSDAGAGGAKGDGSVFEIAQGSNKVTTLATFNGPQGDGLGGVVLDGQGNLYGAISQDGGQDDQGKVIEIAKGSNKVTTLATFNGADGQFPSGVTLDDQGNLYGTTADGWTNGGSAFEIHRGSNAVTTLASFTKPGASPSGVVLDGQGNLYGTDSTGGPNGAATVYEIAPGSNTFTTLATFSGLDGSGVSHLTIDGQGNLYGTTEDGGTYGDGSVFEIAHGSGTFTTLASFNGNVGTTPDAAVGVKLDGQGNLYGVTAYGGANNEGTLFEIARGSDTVTTLASFTNINGSQVSGLLPDGPGTFYGTTDGGGRAGGGSVFKFTLNDQSANILNPPSAVGPTTVVTRKTVKIVTKK